MIVLNIVWKHHALNNIQRGNKTQKHKRKTMNLKTQKQHKRRSQTWKYDTVSYLREHSTIKLMLDNGKRVKVSSSFERKMEFKSGNNK